jgi:hypothetical protein
MRENVRAMKGILVRGSKNTERICYQGRNVFCSEHDFEKQHNRLMPGERHRIIYIPDGTYSPAVFSIPETQLDTRIKSGE